MLLINIIINEAILTSEKTVHTLIKVNDHDLPFQKVKHAHVIDRTSRLEPLIDFNFTGNLATKLVLQLRQNTEWT